MSRFAPLQVDLPESSQSGGYAVQFILQPGAFFLELTDYRLHHCFGHDPMLSPAKAARPQATSPASKGSNLGNMEAKVGHGKPEQKLFRPVMQREHRGIGDRPLSRSFST
jgi:hypothetical protein